ncbi:LpqB family beta-propeller domain-containing protein [Agromyces atrinae]|uniref:GerMN domain-containing protein n=1 Tax=Agromyces atrinae TaxID=592376 RepID=A0A4Q2M5W5_9MICO|nr:GerMN domain-containing protein [Agromyces atrinae]MCI2958054.1 LpqB family beta-propeller domain-containing protein [Agromyces atrinae]NYD66641.1 hypothetical protein [Agromyces atrinae]RXZ87308.1 hypothetical protein ESP50_05145 [Agromyces atrinae]
MRELRSSLARWALALVAVVALSGCTGIPSSGPVQQGQPGAVEESIELDVIARGPQRDATQQQILDGFILAAASPRNNYQIARDFLTPAFASDWHPEAGVTIDLNFETRSFTATSDTSIRVAASPIASVTSTGQYREEEPGSPVPLDYEFEQVDGQWRISVAPPGVLTDEATFAQVFAKHALYFFDPAFEYLVPDLRWFPRQRESTQTSIVKALLAGPSEWLGPGVVTAFPDSVRLRSEAVPVSSGVATVDLSGDASNEVVALQRMQLQLASSLESVRSIRSVDLSFNGVVEALSPLVPEPVETPRVDARALVSAGGAFGFLSLQSQSVTEIPELSDEIEALEPEQVTLGVGGTVAAVLSEAGVSRVQAGSESELLDERPGLIAPALDGYGVVWSVPAGDPGALSWFAPDGSSGTIDPGWPEGTTMVALNVSRDGTRMLAVLSGGSVAHLFVASIQRADAAGAPASLGTPFDLVSVEGDALDATWIDPLNVAALVSVGGEETIVAVQEIGGRSSSRSGAVSGVSIVGGNTQRELRILTAAGEVAVQSGLGWQTRAGSVSLLATQQGQ